MLMLLLLAASVARAGEAAIADAGERSRHEPRLFFRQPANFNIDSLVYKPDPAAIPKHRAHLVIWQMGPNALSTPVTWDAGRYTGFTPPSPLKARQRGPEDRPGSTVV